MLRFQALIRSRMTAQSGRQNAWDVFLIVGSLSLVFGPVGVLLLWFNSSAKGEPQNNLTPGQATSKPHKPTEVYLGEFSSVNGSAERAKSTPNSQGIRVVEFELTGIMLGSNDEVIHFKRRLRRYENRIQATMTEIARSATVEELNDPQTQSLRTKIRDRLNGLFQRPLFENVVFNHIRMYEL